MGAKGIAVGAATSALGTGGRPLTAVAATIAVGVTIILVGAAGEGGTEPAPLAVSGGAATGGGGAMAVGGTGWKTDGGGALGDKRAVGVGGTVDVIDEATESGREGSADVLMVECIVIGGGCDIIGGRTVIGGGPC